MLVVNSGIDDLYKPHSQACSIFGGHLLAFNTQKMHPLVRGQLFLITAIASLVGRPDLGACDCYSERF